MTRIAIVLGSTRPGRRGEAVARWVLDAANLQFVDTGSISFELIDLADHDLPLLDEPAPAKTGQYQGVRTTRWAETIASFDGFVFVTPEYNHSMPAALKNAIDYLYAEWANKSAGFVSYGIDGGTRAVEHLRLVLAELQVATVRAQTALFMFRDFEVTDPVATGVFAPEEHQIGSLVTMLSQVVDWSEALKGASSVEPRSRRATKPDAVAPAGSDWYDAARSMPHQSGEAALHGKQG